MPSANFAELGVPSDLIEVLARREITSPFPIQAATIPDTLARRDVCGRAPTGSGKTLAFGLGIAVNVPKAKPGRPTALVLVPTRELAAQVHRELVTLCAARGRRVASVYGGVGYAPQRRELRRGVDVLVACPGRLEDLIKQRDVSLRDVSIAVVDEADRMADMGFLPAVRRILDATSPDRQTMLFSATLDGEVDVLVRKYQRDPCRHESAGTVESQGDVQHVFWLTERHQRLAVTADLVGKHGATIVFCRTRHGADRLAKQLVRAGVDAAPIHGSRSQSQRDRALREFSAGRVRSLIATDVAARGIHVDDVSCVVHFDPPATEKDYVHRSGRTGRAGADGLVVSLVGAEDRSAVRAIQKALGHPEQLGFPDGTPAVATVVAGQAGRGNGQHRSTGYRGSNGRGSNGHGSNGHGSNGQQRNGQQQRGRPSARRRPKR